MNNVVLSTKNIDDLISDIANEVVKKISLNHSEQTQTPPPAQNPFEGYIPRTEVVGKLATATTLWRWEKQGKLKSYGIGGKRFYKCSDIEQLFTEIKKGLNDGK